ncbi:MAG: cysteine desulfurase NifS [Cyanobacteriota bacterium]
MSIAEKVIYVDNNATSKVDKEVLETMLPYLTDNYGNPSSMHYFGGKVGKALDTAREQVADALGAQPTEIIFTSCGSESNNMAIRSILETIPERRQVITTKVEHPCVINVVKWLEREHGYKAHYLSVNSKGQLDLSELSNAITPKTAFVSIMWANNETGVVFPIEKIAQIIKRKNPNTIIHVDGVQAVGKISIDMSNNLVDMLSISGHKFHAPKGVGALYVKRGTPIVPFLIGGHQERGRRAGTENVASIAGLGKAAELAKKNLKDEATRVKALRDKLEQSILEKVPNAILNGDPHNRVPNTTNISFEYIEGELILLHLSDAGICASSGSACTSGSLEPSHVLRAMGIPFTAIHGSTRFSLSRFNTEEEVDYIIEKVPTIIDKLTQISPYRKEIEKKRIHCANLTDIPQTV